MSDVECVVLKPKNWYRYFVYLLVVPVCTVSGAVLIHRFIYNGEWNEVAFPLNLFMVLVAAYVAGLGIFMALRMLLLQITVDQNGIHKEGVFSRSLAYSDIKKIRAGKGAIEVRGDGLFNRIRIGDLYTHFEPASSLLGKKMQGVEQVEIGGKGKYIDQYFS